MHKWLFEIGKFRVPMYGLMIAIGIIVCFAILRYGCKKKNIPSKFEDYIELSGVGAIVFGFFSATVFQAIYNYIENPSYGFHLGYGYTFIGGLIGGAAFFLIVYFTYGRKKVGAYLTKALPIIACSILIAHCFGRIGCFFAGCCYGKETNSWIGMVFPYSDKPTTKVYPTQLFEALFLLVMFAICFYLTIKKDFKYTFCVYLISYGVFRFLIEYLRDDDRGSFIPGLSPSQFWSLIMIPLGIGLFFFLRWQYKIIDEEEKQKLLEENNNPIEEVENVE